MNASRSFSASPDTDDQDSINDFGDELQQELENEMSASFDNLFGDDADDVDDADDADDASDLFSDTRSLADTSAVGDRATTDFSDDDIEGGDDDNAEEKDDDDEADEDDEDDEEDLALESDEDDNAVDTDLFGDASVADSDDEELDLDFEDPPDGTADANSPNHKPNGTHALIDDESASDGEFEAVEFDLEDIQTGPRGPGTGPTDASEPRRESEAGTSHKKRSRSRVHIGDMEFIARYDGAPPSLIMHLFDSHFRFDGQEGVFLYNGPMRFFFDALNEGKIPVDLVDVLALINCRYYEGCLIVEIYDHRRPTMEPKTKKLRVSELLTSSIFGNSQTSGAARLSEMSPSPMATPAHVIPEPGSVALQNGGVQLISEDTLIDGSQESGHIKVYKKVMRPTSETFNLDIYLTCDRNRLRLSQEDMLEIESMILLSIEEPLDLEPDFQVSRISNAIRYIEYGHLLPHKQRKYNSAEIEAEQAEREEKLKLLNLMDDRKTREFQPSFNRVSQVNEWRHKKYVNDAEVLPEAVPTAPAGKKAPTKKSRSQMSLLSDGRKVIRTLRFVQTINGRSTHTVFHVLELPEGKGLEGIMRWGSLPDTSINGGTKSFAFPNEDIMRMHIDNFKLLLSIENNRLIYDSIYPNGIPTAGPPPGSVVSPAASSKPPPISTQGAAIVPDSAATSPTIDSAISSPVIPASGSLATSDAGVKTDAAKAKASVAKNSARGSRKNSPQPKTKKGTVSSSVSARASVEPEAAKAKGASSAQKAAKEPAKSKAKGDSKKASVAAEKEAVVAESPVQAAVIPESTSVVPAESGSKKSLSPATAVSKPASATKAKSSAKVAAAAAASASIDEP
ncbi:Transcription factor spt20, partial [Coemansia sp. Benny D115]